MGRALLCAVVVTAAVCLQPTIGQNKRRLKEGDYCRLPLNQRGVCRLLYSCPSAIKELNDNQMWPLTCAQTPTGASIICCDEGQAGPPSSAPPPLPTRTTRPISRPASNTTIPVVPEKRRSGVISKQKCNEYSRWISKPILRLEDKDLRVPGACADVTQFIFGGVEAQPLEFPHMAHLGFGKDLDQLSWSCGGSLISDQYILTAGHCLQKPDGTKVTHVRLGTSDPNPGSTQIIQIAKVIPHPQYNPKQVYKDIALLKLVEPVVFDDYKRPACLHAHHSILEKNGMASGWGATEKDKKGSKKLLKVNLPFMSSKECKTSYPVRPPQLSKGIDDDTQLCAGAIESKKDTCQGDSGGPLQVMLTSPMCMYSLVGITSFGGRCGKAPGVYTRVSAYVQWIEDEVWPPVN